MAPKVEYIKCLTPPFRLSFPNLTEPRAATGQDESQAKYGIKMLFPKEGYTPAEKAQLDAIRAACKKVADEYWNNKIPPGVKRPFRDGDDPEQTQYSEDRGHWFASARSKNRPGVVDGALREIKNPEEIKERLYAGCWCRATVAVGAGENSGNKYVHLLLNNIQKVRDDKPFGNRKKATEDFGAVEGYREDGAFSDAESDFNNSDF